MKKDKSQEAWQSSQLWESSEKPRPWKRQTQCGLPNRSYQIDHKWYRCWFCNQSHQLNRKPANCPVVGSFINRLHFEKRFKKNELTTSCSRVSSCHCKIRLCRFCRNIRENLKTADWRTPYQIVSNFEIGLFKNQTHTYPSSGRNWPHNQLVGI